MGNPEPLGPDQHAQADLFPATMVRHLDEELPVTPLLIPEWLVIAAIHGTGSLLLGPHPDGAQAVIPPAVLTRTPDGDFDDYSDDGWRIAIWRFVPGDTSRVDAHRPSRLNPASLLEIRERVLAEAPEHEAWLLEEIRLRAQCLGTLVRYAQADAQVLHALRDELDDLLLDCTEAFGGQWVDHHLSDL